MRGVGRRPGCPSQPKPSSAGYLLRREMLPSLAFLRRVRQRVQHPAPGGDKRYDHDGREKIDPHPETVIVIAFGCGLVLTEILDRGIACRAATSQPQFAPRNSATRVKADDVSVAVARTPRMTRHHGIDLCRRHQEPRLSL